MPTLYEATFELLWMDGRSEVNTLTEFLDALKMKASVKNHF